MSVSSPTPLSCAACWRSTRPAISRPISICAPRSPGCSRRATSAGIPLPSSRRRRATAPPRRSRRFVTSRPACSLRNLHASDSHDLRPFGNFLGDDRGEFLRRRSPLPLLHREDPDRAALRHLRILAWEEQVHPGLHLRGIDAPAGLDRYVLLAVDLERNRYCGDARPCREFPDDLPGPGVERAELAVVGAASEQEPAAGGEHGTPVERRQFRRPHLLAGVEIPRLQLADVIGAGDHLHHVLRDAHGALAAPAFGRLAGPLGAEILVSGDVEHPRLRAVGDRRPVLAAPQARAELRGLSGAGLAVLVDVGPAGLGVEGLEDVLAYVGFTRG